MSAQAYTYATTKDAGKAALQLALYVIAQNVNNSTGATFCSIKTLMRECRVKSDRTMRNYISTLSTLRLIRKKKRFRDNGGNTSCELELVGFLEWFEAQQSDVQPARITGGVSPTKKPMQPARITGGPGSIPTGAIDQVPKEKGENKEVVRTDDTTRIVSPQTRQQVELMGLDPDEMIDKMRFSKRPIINPNAYLLKIAKQEASERLGISEAVVARMASSDMKTRAQAMVAAVVASASPKPHTARPSAALLASLGRAAA